MIVISARTKKKVHKYFNTKIIWFFYYLVDYDKN